MSPLLSFSTWWSKDPVKAALILVVSMIHIALLASIYLTKPVNTLFEQKKLTVKTWTPSKTKATTITTSKKAVSAPVAKPTIKKQEPTEKTSVKKSDPPPKTVKKQEKIKEKEKPVEVKQKKTAQDSRLKELQERIAKIEAKNDRMSTKSEFIVPAALTLSSPISEMQIEETLATEDDSVSFLVGYLQQCLQLPDVGEVQIQLTFRNDGSIENVKVLRAESKENKKYLEEHLTKLTFPSMNTLSKESSRSFLLTFCNKF